MIFRNIIQRILLGLAICFCLLIGIGQSQIQAAIRQLEEAPWTDSLSISANP